jgi:hypothetical protein
LTYFSGSLVLFWLSGLLWQESLWRSLSGSVQSAFAIQDLASESLTNIHTSWYGPVTPEPYVPPKNSIFFYRYLFFCLGLGKSLIIAFNSSWVQGLNSTVVTGHGGTSVIPPLRRQK